MIEEVGFVSAVERIGGTHVVWVRTQVKSTCGKCYAQSHCGTSAIAKAFAHKTEDLRFELPHPVKVGQEVSLGIPEESLLKASFIMYLLPLFVLILSVLVGQSLLPIIGLEKEIWLILLAGVSSFVTFKIARKLLSHCDQTNFYPQILEVFPIKSVDIAIKQI